MWLLEGWLFQFHARELSFDPVIFGFSECQLSYPKLTWLLEHYIHTLTLWFCKAWLSACSLTKNVSGCIFWLVLPVIIAPLSGVIMCGVFKKTELHNTLQRCNKVVNTYLRCTNRQLGSDYRACVALQTIRQRHIVHAVNIVLHNAVSKPRPPFIIELHVFLCCLRPWCSPNRAVHDSVFLWI